MADSKYMMNMKEFDYENEGGWGGGFRSLPEGCIAAVISFTGARDACRLATVSRIFKSAADSDSVWERFLPFDYAEIISRSDGADSILSSLSKKDLFFFLVNHPLLIDHGTKSFSLDKSTGKKCYRIAARGLLIIWADTPRYWAWHSLPESRFSEVAELISVCWLEIQGKMKASSLSPDTNYAAFLIFKMAEAAYGFSTSADLMITTVGGKVKTQTAYWNPQAILNQRHRIVPRRVPVFNRIQATVSRVQLGPQMDVDGKLPKQRGDGWMELEIGEFFIRRDKEGEVEMLVKEVQTGNWKGGLVVEGIEIRPKMDTQ